MIDVLFIDNEPVQILAPDVTALNADVREFASIDALKQQYPDFINSDEISCSSESDLWRA